MIVQQGNFFSHIFFSNFVDFFHQTKPTSTQSFLDDCFLGHLFTIVLEVDKEKPPKNQAGWVVKSSFLLDKVVFGLVCPKIVSGLATLHDCLSEVFFFVPLKRLVGFFHGFQDCSS